MIEGRQDKCTAKKKVLLEHDITKQFTNYFHLTQSNIGSALPVSEEYWKASHF